MDALTRMADRTAKPLLRISLGLVLLWIGALKFADPSPVVGLLEASFPFLAFPGFVYLLGVVEVVAGGALFLGTLVIFLIAPMVSFGEAGFPFLTLAGEFLLKDFVLMAAAIALLSLVEEPTPAEGAAA